MTVLNGTFTPVKETTKEVATMRSPDRGQNSQLLIKAKRFPGHSRWDAWCCGSNVHEEDPRFDNETRIAAVESLFIDTCLFEDLADIGDQRAVAECLDYDTGEVPFNVATVPVADTRLNVWPAAMFRAILAATQSLDQETQMVLGEVIADNEDFSHLLAAAFSAVMRYRTYYTTLASDGTTVYVF